MLIVVFVCCFKHNFLVQLSQHVLFCVCASAQTPPKPNITSLLLFLSLFFCFRVHIDLWTQKFYLDVIYRLPFLLLTLPPPLRIYDRLEMNILPALFNLFRRQWSKREVSTSLFHFFWGSVKAIERCALTGCQLWCWERRVKSEDLQKILKTWISKWKSSNETWKNLFHSILTESMLSKLT